MIRRAEALRRDGLDIYVDREPLPAGDAANYLAERWRRTPRSGAADFRPGGRKPGGVRGTQAVYRLAAAGRVAICDGVEDALRGIGSGGFAGVAGREGRQREPSRTRSGSAPGGAGTADRRGAAAAGSGGAGSRRSAGCARQPAYGDGGNRRGEVSSWTILPRGRSFAPDRGRRAGGRVPGRNGRRPAGTRCHPAGHYGKRSAVDSCRGGRSRTKSAAWTLAAAFLDAGVPPRAGAFASGHRFG